MQPPVLLILSAILLIGCRPAPPPAIAPGDPAARRGDEIMAAGRLFHTTARVVLWTDPGGYDAYRLHRRFIPEGGPASRAAKRLARFDTFRGGLPEELGKRVRDRGWSIEDLREVVSQVVIHFDACGTSKRCFEVLHDVRGLSCHFLLDLDGAIYQTLDLKERAWHAGEANDVSVGIEIAHIGASAGEDAASGWYVKDAEGVRIRIPEEMGNGGLPAGFVGRPRRPEPVRGRVQGKDLLQYDFTEEQYAALEKLLVALCRVFPRIRARIPRGADGKLLDRAFASPEELMSFQGIIGHWHASEDKVDPGPAFDWERILAALRRAGIAER